MDASKHTPGPWSVMNGTDVFGELGGDSGDGIKADSTDGWQVADCNTGITFVEGEQMELGYGVRMANARLIAAAPELLDELRECESAFSSLLGGDTDLFPRICGSTTLGNRLVHLRAAIAKATGEQP
jgi:hypothetical protein